MTYFAIHKPTGHQYDIPATAHGTMFRLIEHWAAIGHDRAMKAFREHGKIETKVVVFHRKPESINLSLSGMMYDPATRGRLQ